VRGHAAQDARERADPEGRIAHVLGMVERCQELGLGCNVDLIYGWPRQKVDHMLRDLDTMVRLRGA
jgi:coproporphyrinogen III oxidase-like Fe-S oxidoreductase